MTDDRPAAPRTVLAVLGPTATGKSELGVALARALGPRRTAEIINADSMQLYRGMDIGTAKLPPADRQGVDHHLLDVWPVTRSAAVAEYQVLARLAIESVLARGAVPILVGGSGLYLRAALDHLEFPGESPAVRAKWEAELASRGAADLHRELGQLDAAAALAILPTNGRRLVRALEVIEITGAPFTARMPGFDSLYDTVHIGLDRVDLDERVERRVVSMIDRGLVEEVRSLATQGLRGSPTAAKALGYAQILNVLGENGEMVGDLDEAVAVTARATRRFVRRQRSWFRRDPRICWFDAGAPDLLDQVLATVPPNLVE